jgi:uncharacterized glyoxalase superfamily protein PhnB
MSIDPLDALRDPSGPIDPDPGFAARLRDRLERRILDHPIGGDMTDTGNSTAVLTPYIAVNDARAAMDWYVDVFGAQRRGEPFVGPDNRIGHAELTIGGAELMLADEYPDFGLVGPDKLAGRPFSLHLTVDAVDALTDRAQAAGATVERPPSDNPYGRIAVIIDPFGHRWMLNQRLSR